MQDDKTRSMCQKLNRIYEIDAADLEVHLDGDVSMMVTQHDADVVRRAWDDLGCSVRVESFAGDPDFAGDVRDHMVVLPFAEMEKVEAALREVVRLSDVSYNGEEGAW